MASTSIVIPCFNESERLNCAAFLAFAQCHDDIELRFVNDGSEDATLSILRKMEAQNRLGIRVVDLPENQGKAEAVRLGMLEAVEEGFGYVGFWDADLATPLNAIPVFQNVLQRAPDIEVVVGTRLNLVGHKIERKRMRSLCGKLFATASAFVLGKRLVDTQCGAKLFRVNQRMQQWLSQPFQSRWIFDVELLARLRLLLREEKRRELAEKTDLTRQIVEQSLELENSLFELPLDSWHDVAGSKLKSHDFIKAAGELSQLIWQYRVRRGKEFLAALETHAPIHTWRDWSQVPTTAERDADDRRAA